jgi:signal transduction histidine kinase/DNA-binding response OmpR family regulator
MTSSSSKMPAASGGGSGGGGGHTGVVLSSQTPIPSPSILEATVCNILIVDDEPSNLLAIEAILEPLGQNIVRAASGIEALKHALKMEFCVVLLDVQMPEMDGLETASLLRKRPKTRDVPIIFLTAISKDKSWVTRGYEAGAVDYLFKPYDPDALRTKVATFVDLGKKNVAMRALNEALRVGSQRELAELKLWSERRYQDLADSMPQVVWSSDETGTRIAYHNRRWDDLAANRDEGGDAQTLERDYRVAFSSITHPKDLESFVAGWEDAVRSGDSWEAEIRLGSAPVGYRFHLVRAVPRRDDAGALVGWIGTATDIDARVRADRALRMLADASHSLNSSLEEPRELEKVLRRALPLLGDGVILDVKRPDEQQHQPQEGMTTALGSSSPGSRSERFCVTRSGVDRERLSDPRFDLGPATVVYSGRAEFFLDVDRDIALSTPSHAHSHSHSHSHSPPTTSTNPPSSFADETIMSAVASSGEVPKSMSANAALATTPSGRGVEHLRFLKELGVSAYMCLPLVSRNRTIGTLSFVRFARTERFEEADTELAGDLARRIAVAIDNAHLHETTERRREELELANKSKDVFLATLSHELRTPLNAIVGWTDMMKKGTLTGDEIGRAMETIDRNAQALNGLVADLLDVSRIVTGTLKLESKLISVSSVVEAAVTAARPLFTAREINLELEAAADGSDRIRGDAGRLRQVIANLLSNAMKFTPKMGTVTVQVAKVPDAEIVRVTVKDTGEGILPEFLPHVFERFRQEETGRAKGLGLGLAIVKHLVEEHGGKASAASDGRGKGSAFTIDLPIAVESTQESELRESDGALASAEPQGEPDLNGIHILIVEDDPDGNELVCAILERYGARVTSATNAGRALEILESEDDRPEVLVSDIGLPDMDGMELIKTVRERPSMARIPAVALTAYASRQDATKAISAGFDAHVAKPVQPATLGTVLMRVLASTRLASSAA